VVCPFASSNYGWSKRHSQSIKSYPNTYCCNLFSPDAVKGNTLHPCSAEIYDLARDSYLHKVLLKRSSHSEWLWLQINSSPPVIVLISLPIRHHHCSWGSFLCLSDTLLAESCLYPINGSKCRRDRPRFGLDSISPEIWCL
jgi:hypothetical protein